MYQWICTMAQSCKCWKNSTVRVWASEKVQVGKPCWGPNMYTDCIGPKAARFCCIWCQTLEINNSKMQQVLVANSWPSNSHLRATDVWTWSRFCMLTAKVPCFQDSRCLPGVLLESYKYRSLIVKPRLFQLLAKQGFRDPLARPIQIELTVEFEGLNPQFCRRTESSTVIAFKTLDSRWGLLNSTPKDKVLWSCARSSPNCGIRKGPVFSLKQAERISMNLPARRRTKSSCWLDMDPSPAA